MDGDTQVLVYASDKCMKQQGCGLHSQWCLALGTAVWDDSGGQVTGGGWRYLGTAVSDDWDDSGVMVTGGAWH